MPFDRRVVRWTAGAACALALASASPAQERESVGLPGRGAHEQQVRLDVVHTMHVSSLGASYSKEEWNLNFAPGAPGNFTPEACTGVAAHTDKDFGPGSYTIQAGFAQGELQATTYTLPPDHFPLRLDTIETFWATANATVNTVTEWSVMLVAGTSGL